MAKDTLRLQSRISKTLKPAENALLTSPIHKQLRLESKIHKTMRLVSKLQKEG